MAAKKNLFGNLDINGFNKIKQKARSKIRDEGEYGYQIKVEANEYDDGQLTAYVIDDEGNRINFLFLRPSKYQPK